MTTDEIIALINAAKKPAIERLTQAIEARNAMIQLAEENAGLSGIPLGNEAEKKARSERHRATNLALGLQGVIGLINTAIREQGVTSTEQLPALLADVTRTTEAEISSRIRPSDVERQTTNLHLIMGAIAGQLGIEQQYQVAYNRLEPVSPIPQRNVP